MDINGRESVSKNFATWPILPRDYVERRVAGMRWKNGWSCGFAIDVSGIGMIGGISFGSPSQGETGYEIGYGLHPDHWGQGYITEAAELICEYLFQRYPIEKITAYANLDNIGSQRVLESGFQNVGEGIKIAREPLIVCIDLNAIARNINACRLVPARF